jgi:hypothetical protein
VAARRSTAVPRFRVLVGAPPHARSDLAGWPHTEVAPATRATSEACACTWLRPCTGCPSAFALTGAKAGERRVLLEPLHSCPVLTVRRAGLTLIADKNCFRRDFETALADGGIRQLSGSGLAWLHL